MNRKRTLLIVIVFLLVVSVIGASYAYFAATTSNKGNDEITEITTEELGSIKWEGTKVYESGDSLPGEIGIQTFKVSKNSDNGKGIYEIDLEGIIDEAFNEDVLISLYKTTEPDKNYVKVTEGESTITGDDDTKMYYKEDKLQAVGTPELVYGPRALETKDPIILYQADFDNTNFPETTFYLVYEYLNKDNQDAEQGKSFSGTINVRLILEKIIGEESDIDITYTSNRSDYVNTDETLTITATSEKYNIARYSFDNIIYTPVDNPSKTVTITKTYTEEKDNIIYFKDDVGNTKSKTLDLFLDKTGPSITAKTTLEWDKTNTISITLEDEKSGLAGYALAETETDPSEWTSITGKSTTIAKDVTSNKKYYVYAKDVLGNISHKDVEVSHVDETAPVINEINEQENYGATSVISVSVKDNETGIVGYAFTTTNEEPTEWTSVDNVITEEKYTYEASSNGTIYFWVKDRVGNITSKPINVTKVDTTAPTITLSLSDELTWTSSKTLTMNFSDDESGLLGYAITTTEQEPNTWIDIAGTNISETKEILLAGTYYVWAIDKTGLINYTIKTIAYIDTTPPVASMVLSKATNSIIVNASGSSDLESGIVRYEYSMDDITYYSSSSSNYTFTGLSAGTYKIYLKVIDGAGNVATVNKSIILTTPISTKITQLSQTDKTNLATDDYGNVRYIGEDPNNYINVDGDIWRIIGVMKNIDDGTGNKSDRVKIIRNESIGGYSWDTSASSVNDGYGVNEWSQSKLMKLLNSGYESEKVGGSLYWNNKSGTCYTGDGNYSDECDFTNIGMKEKMKNLIGNVVWNLGSNGTNDYFDSSKGLTKHFYTYERSTNTGKICTSGTTCNDKVTRTTTWTGKVGLMYPSDYGYATSGGTSTSRATCLNTLLIYGGWGISSTSDCRNNDWFHIYDSRWLLSPVSDSSSANNVFCINTRGHLSDCNASDTSSVYPVVYLRQSVYIQGGDGSIDNPFTLEN